MIKITQARIELGEEFAPFLTPIEPVMAQVIAQAIKVPKRYYVDDTVKRAVREMPPRDIIPQFWPYLTHYTPTWYEWEENKLDGTPGRVGALVSPLPDGERGYSAVYITEIGAHHPMAARGFSRSPEWRKAETSYGGQDICCCVEGLDEAPEVAARKLAHKVQGLNALFLLLNSEASPVVRQESRENFSAINQKRQRKGALPLQTLQPIVIDISKLGITQEEVRAAKGNPDELKRICVEHLVHCHFQVYHTNEGDKVRYKNDYKRYEGSPRGSTVNQPREFHVTRSNPGGHHKLRGPGGIQLL
jgi:hypothetical protein